MRARLALGEESARDDFRRAPRLGARDSKAIDAPLRLLLRRPAILGPVLDSASSLTRCNGILRE